MRVSGLFLAATVVTLAGAAPAGAAFDDPSRASIGPLAARSPEVAVNARGDAAIAYVRGRRRDAMIVVGTRPAGGAWGEPVAISPRGRPAIDPQVAVDAQGLVVVTWRQVVGRRTVRTEDGRRRQALYVARTRERPITDSRWSPVTTLSSSRQKVGPPRLAMDASGRALAVWHWGTGTSRRSPGHVGEMQLSERASDGSWSGPVRVSRSRLCLQVRKPRADAGPRGHAAVWWQCDLAGGRATAVGISRAPGGEWGPEVELPFRTEGRVAADLAISDTGRVAAVSAAGDGSLRWWRGEAGERLSLRELPALGRVERAGRRAGMPQVAIGSTGDALSAWTDRRGQPRLAPIAADLGVGAALALGPPSDDTGGARVAVAGTGRRGVVAWRAEGRILASERSSDGTTAAGAPVSRRGAAGSPAVGVDAAGNAVVAWTRMVGGTPVVERAETSPS